MNKEFLGTMTVFEFIEEFGYFNWDMTNMYQYEASAKVRHYDVADEEGYSMYNLFEILDDNRNVIATYTDYDFSLSLKGVI